MQLKRLLMNAYKNKISVADQVVDSDFPIWNKYQNHVDVTDDFKNLVVAYCSKIKEFEIDGMKFRATCERIE